MDYRTPVNAGVFFIPLKFVIESLSKATISSLPYKNINDKAGRIAVQTDRYFVRYYICKEEATLPFPSVS
jgi:hypothetical protein